MGGNMNAIAQTNKLLRSEQFCGATFTEPAYAIIEAI